METVANSIKKCEANFECYIRLVVTNNVAKVLKMPRLLETKGNNDEKMNAITYGYLSHRSNLLAIYIHIQM